MKFKKFAAAAAAAAVLSFAAPMAEMLPDAVSVTASAAEQKLLVGAVDGGWEGIKSMGGGYLFDWGLNSIYRIGESELEAWRKTGTLTPVIAKNNSGVEVDAPNGNFDNEGRYSYFYYWDSFGDDVYHIFEFDKENNSIKLVDTLKRTSDTGTRTVVSRISSNGIALVDYRYYSDNVQTGGRDEWIDLSNKKVLYTVEFTNKDDGIYVSYCPDKAIVNSWISRGDKYYEYYIYNEGGQSYLCGLLKNGETEILEQRALEKDGYYISGVGNGFFTYYANSYKDSDNNRQGDLYVFLDSTGKSYYIDPALFKSESPEIAGVYGNVAILEDYVRTNGKEYIQLIELNDNGCKALSERYLYARDDSPDGETFLVRNDSELYGYIDKTGKELAMGFDKATPFNGDYAAVVKDGKAYLIDRNMNKVSEALDARSVREMGKDLFEFELNVNGNYVDRFVTPTVKSAGKPAAPTTPTTPMNPTFSKPSTNGVTLTWDKVSGATGYIIKYSVDGGKTWITKTVSTNTITLADLMPGTAYIYRIAAKNGDTEGSYTSDYTFRTADKPVETSGSVSDPTSDTTSNPTSGTTSNPTSGTTSDTTSKPDSKSDGDNTNPPTGFAGVMAAFGAAVIAGAIVIVSKKRR